LNEKNVLLPRAGGAKPALANGDPPLGAALPEAKAERSSSERTASQPVGPPEGGDALRSRELGPLRSTWDGLPEAKAERSSNVETASQHMRRVNKAMWPQDNTRREA